MRDVMIGPFAAEDLDGRAGHVDVIVRLGPVQLQVAAGQMGRDLRRRSARQHAGDGHGTRPGAARQRLAGAAFPDAHRRCRRGG